jgi:hypothetical protein
MSYSLTIYLSIQFAWGPLAFLIAYCIAVQHPIRHALQIIISTGQVYGDVLYYATSLLDESYCRPEGYYFWFYYFFFNFIWMVVGCCEYFYDYDMIFWVAIDVYQIMLKRVLSRFGGRLRSFRRLRLRGKMIDLMKGLSRWGLDLQLHRTMQTIIMYDIDVQRICTVQIRSSQNGITQQNSEKIITPTCRRQTERQDVEERTKEKWYFQ